LGCPAAQEVKGGMVESSGEDESDSLGQKLSSYFDEVGAYLRVTKAQKILRRYFAMNAFDGAMTSLGVVIGAYISRIVDPNAIIGVILLGGVAMAVSGFSGTYMTESAERNKSLNELEEAMLVDLGDTIYGQASRFVSAFAALVDGGAPFLASIPSVVPFYMALHSIIPIGLAFAASIAASLATLFLLGIFLGRVSEQNVIYSGIKMVLAGIAVAMLALIINGGH
jgi:predicted membrane protein (TIGR00267 family)